MLVRSSLMPKKSASPKSPARRYFKEVRFRQIRALVELARQGSFASAATSLGLAVPSVWQQVRALEDEYGVPLVVARGSVVSLTTDGQLLVDIAAPLVEGFDSLREVFTDRHRKQPRSLSIVAPAAMFSGPLRSRVIHYRKKHPEVRVRLIDRPSYTAREMMEADEADVAIMGIASGDDSLPQMQLTALVRYPFHVIYPEGHPLADKQRLTLADLVKHPLVLSGHASCSHRQIRHTFTQAGLVERLNVAMTATNPSLLLSYVSAGLGICIGTNASSMKLPRPLPGEPALIMRDATHLFGHEEVFFVQRKGRFEPPHVKAFRELVVKGMSET
jgi:molybdate transport repressor ModE-like protein